MPDPRRCARPSPATSRRSTAPTSTQADDVPARASRGGCRCSPAGRLTVAAVGARNLHLLATTEALGPAARAGGRAARRVRRASSGRCASTTRWCVPGARADRRVARGRRSRRSAARSGVAHGRLPRRRPARLRSLAAPRRPRRLRAGQRALRGGPRLRDDPRAGPAGARRWSTSWRAPPSPGSPRAQALLARAISPARRGRRARPCDASLRPTPTRIRKAVLTRSAADPVAFTDGAAGVTDAPLLDRSRNAARLLKAFLTREESLGVSELARRLGLGKSTVHRLLTTLVAEGLVEQDPRTGGYRLGLVMFELGEAVQVHMDLHAAAGPVLAHLREETGESCQVGVLDGHEVVYVDRLESAHTLRLFTETGRRVPVHCTQLRQGAAGASRPSRSRERFLATACRSPRLTPHTITDPDALRAELGHGARPRLGRGRRRARDRGRLDRRARSATRHGARGRRDQHRRARSARFGAMPRRRLARGRRRGRRGGLAPARLVAGDADVAARRRADRARHRRARQGAGALRRPPHPRADRAVHRRRARPRHGRRLRRAAGAGAAAARRRRPRSSGYKVGLTSQADAEDDRRRLPRLRPGARVDGLPRRRRDPARPLHPAQDRGRDRLRARRAAAGPGRHRRPTPRRAIAGVAAAMEIVDSRIEDWRIKLADTVADLASNGAVAMSSPARAARRARHPADRDDAHPQRRARRHRRRRRRAGRPAGRRRLAGQRARRERRRPRARPPDHDRRAARRRADDAPATCSAPSSTGSAR